jgi:hypothetical protein
MDGFSVGKIRVNQRATEDEETDLARINDFLVVQ